MKDFILLFGLFGAFISFGQKKDTMVDPRDQKAYETVQIGEQVWMAENMAYRAKLENMAIKAKLLNKEKITSTEGLESYWIDSIRDPNKYRFFYNWRAAQVVCPEGWHLPTQDEFKILLKTIGGDSRQNYKDLLKGGVSGFDIQFTGWIRVSPSTYYCSLENSNNATAFWCALQHYEESSRILYAPAMSLKTSRKKVNINDTSTDPGLCVRCIKNQR